MTVQVRLEGRRETDIWIFLLKEGPQDDKIGVTIKKKQGIFCVNSNEKQATEYGEAERDRE